MDPETMRGWWFGWRWGNDRRVEGELLRSQAAIVRHHAAALREEASFTRWHSERECEYGRYLRDRLEALRSAAEARTAPWLVPRRSDPTAEPLAVPVAVVAESGARPTARTQPHRGAQGRTGAHRGAQGRTGAHEGAQGAKPRRPDPQEEPRKTGSAA